MPTALKSKKKSDKPVTARKKVSFDMPRPLFERAEAAANELNLKDTSSFLRQAVEKLLDDLQRTKLERELEAGYRANAAVSERTMQDFQFVDAEKF